LIYLFDEMPVNVLAGLLAKPTLLAFDYDGTLAPIVSNRDAAAMRPSTLERFTRVCELYNCAVVTGRSREDVKARLDSAKVWKIVGQHGIDTGDTTTAPVADVAKVARYLSQRLLGLPGVELEDKGLSLAIHFRGASCQQHALDAINAALAQLPVPMRPVGGKAVVNLIPENAPHKGDAIMTLRQEAAATRVLYVGDDITDEDVFELRQPSWLVTVRVGSSVHSDASYYLRDQSEIDRLLDELLSLGQSVQYL
jgi:trehalose 6-phosphate phosphatase